MSPTVGDLFGIHLPIPLHEFFVGLGVRVAVLVLWLQVRHHGCVSDMSRGVLDGEASSQ